MLLLVLILAVACAGAVVHLDRMRREEDREAREHHRALLREVRRHRGD